MLWSRANTGNRAPAAVNLKRLYLCLLAATLIIGTVSLVSLLKVRDSIDELARTSGTRIHWIDEMSSRLGKAQASFHRFINSSDQAHLPNDDLDGAIAELDTRNLIFSSAFSDEMRHGAYRFKGLVNLAAGALELGKWEDLQIIMRDTDRSLDKLFSLLDEEKENLHLAIALKKDATFRALRITGLLLGFSMLMSVLVTLGLYSNWRRLERAVLGL
jgi:hypothetical protein